MGDERKSANDQAKEMARAGGRGERPVRVRFAPSPTGFLHVGNARTALFNWLFARHHGGEFMLRLDDTDIERSRDEYADAIKEDLKWLGLAWDVEARQSERYPAYEKAVRTLSEKGRLYPCYETAAELDLKRRKQKASGLPPVYDRAALNLTPEEMEQYERQGRRPHWRFRLEHRRVEWEDMVRGHQSIDCASLSDPVMIREGGGYLYTLPSVVDDIDFAISHVIRGEDHVANTAVQIQLFEALGASPPAFGHHNLLVGADGEALSKRKGDLALRDLRQQGLEAMAVNSLISTIGTSSPVRPFLSLADIAGEFDLAGLSRAPARFDPAELRHLNARLLHETPFEMVRERLEEMHVGGGEKFWLAVRGNLETLAEARDWWQIVAFSIEPEIEDEAFCRQAADLLPGPELDENSWREWTRTLKKESGRKGRALFHPLRLALTGRENGPELGKLLPLIGHERARARLLGEVA